MKCSPKNNNINAIMLTVFLTVIAIFSIYFAGNFPHFKWMFQLSFLCFSTVAIQILIKFILTEYEYFCDNETLMIYEKVGKRSAMIASIPLKYSASYLLSLDDFLLEKDNYKITDKYIFTRNFKATDIYIYVSETNGTASLIKLECTEKFAKYVNNKIDIALKGTDTNEL